MRPLPHITGLFYSLNIAHALTWVKLPFYGNWKQKKVRFGAEGQPATGPSVAARPNAEGMGIFGRSRTSAPAAGRDVPRAEGRRSYY